MIDNNPSNLSATPADNLPQSVGLAMPILIERCRGHANVLIADNVPEFTEMAAAILRLIARAEKADREENVIEVIVCFIKLLACDRLWRENVG